ncbi:sulfite exporter TauE/SafE family protein [Calidithermus chliarophilus]|uniref:sulfite exporter TauE/SafE family protein n=1 Tax=Calidithermus chliarophilus TaxID=52023 RepID=UPI0004841B53|nr:sulfite exporter TauE/SafE family protein [Calidithermus chliarophilus]
MPELSPLHWFLVALAALIVGASKTGLPGGVTLAVALFAQVFPARESTGALLPVLICADVLAVWLLHRRPDWRLLLRLFPWTALGVLLGWGLLGRIDDAGLRLVIGVLIVGMTLYQLAQRFRGRPAAPAPSGASPLFTAGMGTAAGVTTMIANAAGPFMALYLLAMRMGKLEFVVVNAWFFLAVNSFKVPFAANLGLITWDSLRFNLLLVPLVLAGAVLGRWMLRRINQQAFELMVLWLALIGGLRLLMPV